MKELESDILIIGGGLTGLMTAFALSSLKINIILIDKHNLTDSKNFYKDYRTTAVAEGSKVFFEKINICSKLKKYANPIKTIKVFDRTEDRKIHFNNQIEKNNLGYIVRNNIIKKILLKYLKRKKNVQLFNNLPLDKISSSNEHIFANTNRFTFKSKLIIAADGKQSHVRSILKTYRYFKKYNHRALVVNFNHSLNHNNTAYDNGIPSCVT